MGLEEALPSVHHALSFDIEDWFHLVGIDATADPRTWDTLPSLVEERTDQILRICEDAGVQATFFVVGWVAERRRRLVRRILDAGHEVASHSFWHRPVCTLTPEEFRRDLRDSIAVLEGCGARVRGYRAPSFSITAETEWALEIIADEGLGYDASLISDSRRRLRPRGDLGAHWVEPAPGRRLAEIPVSSAAVAFGLRAPYSGGAFLRLLPMPVVHRAVRREAEQGRGTVVYLHPRDLAPDCPRVRMPLNRRIRTYGGAATAERKLVALISSYRFTTCGSLVDALACA